MDRAAGRADRDHPLHRHGHRQVRALRRIQAVRSSGVAAHDRGVMNATPHVVQGVSLARSSRPKGLHYVLILIACVAGCRNAQTPSSDKKPAAPLQTVQLKHPGAAKVVVGTEIEAIAEGLPPGRKVDLLWKTVTGGWVIEDYYHFRGKKFTETSRSIGQAETDDNGRLFAHFRVPED